MSVLNHHMQVLVTSAIIICRGNFEKSDSGLYACPHAFHPFIAAFVLSNTRTTLYLNTFNEECARKKFYLVIKCKKYVVISVVRKTCK